MSDDDLIRRGDAVRSAEHARDRSIIAQQIRALPADPRAAAAVRLAEAADKSEAAESALDFASDGPWEQRRIAQHARDVANLAWREALAAWRSLAKPEPSQRNAEASAPLSTARAVPLEAERCPECKGGGA